jgi:hypothetical protein
MSCVRAGLSPGPALCFDCGRHFVPRNDGVAYQADVFAQYVGFARESRRRVNSRDGVFDAREVGQPSVDRQIARACGNVALEQGELAVPAENA